MARKVKKSRLRRLVRSPWWPATLSAVVAPGLGQISNRDYGRGFLLLFASLGTSFWFFHRIHDELRLLLPIDPSQWEANRELVREAYEEIVRRYPETFTTFYILIVVVWAFSIVDAYLTARRRTRFGTTHSNA